MKLRFALGLGALVAPALVAPVMVLGTGPAQASSGPYTCSGGAIPAGTYDGITVTGTCTFTGDVVTVNGPLTVAPGAILNDHAASHTTVQVNGDVNVGEGGVLGLGRYGPPGTHSDSVVSGSIMADRPLTLYLGGLTVLGSVRSIGGDAPAPGPISSFRNFPMKDDTVYGAVTIEGWRGGWLGFIRNDVHGAVTIAGNQSVLVPAPDGCGEEVECTGTMSGVDPDSTEVQTNVIHGALKCSDNVPAAQVNADDGGQPNSVTGRKQGECAAL